MKDMDGERCLQAAPTPGSVSVATGGVAQDDVLNIKEEPTETDLDAGPAALQHMDADTSYKRHKRNVSCVKEERDPLEDTSTLESEPLLMKEASGLEVNEDVADSQQDMDRQPCLQATSTPAITTSMNVVAGGVVQDDGLNIKEEWADTDMDVGPTVLQHMDTRCRPVQPDVSIIKQEGRSEDNNMNAVLCGGVKVETIEYERRVSSPAVHTYDYCHETYASNQALVHHIDVVHTKVGYRCSECNKEFKGKLNLQRHMKRLHSQEQHEVSSPAVHTCEYCHKTYASNQALVHHIDVVHTKVSYRCSECNKEFKGKLNLQRHMKRLHSQEQHEADTDTQRRNEASQSKQRAPSQLYSCDKCVKTYTSKTSLLAHYRNRHSTESHKCTRCDKIFASKAYLYRHTSYAHSEQEHECAVCKKIFTSKVALYTHVYQAHRPRPAGSKARIYTCDYCKKMFSDKRIIRNHITRVHFSGSYKCHQCDKIFKCKAYLMGHKANVHTAEGHQLHSCTNCGQNFSSKWNCRQHEKRGKCARPTAGNTSAAASTSRQQHNVVIVKEEPADGELDLGPVVFQHMDCNYRPYKPEPGLD